MPENFQRGAARVGSGLENSGLGSKAWARPCWISMILRRLNCCAATWQSGSRGVWDLGVIFGGYPSLSNESMIFFFSFIRRPLFLDLVLHQGGGIVGGNPFSGGKGKPKIISSGDIPNSMRCSFLVLAPPCSPCRTSWNPGGTLVEPWWNPRGTLVEAYLRAAPPRSLSRLRSHSFQLVGENTKFWGSSKKTAPCGWPWKALHRFVRPVEHHNGTTDNAGYFTLTLPVDQPAQRLLRHRSSSETQGS